MAVESAWNMAIDTMMRISHGLHMCNDALHKGDFNLWLKGLYHLYGELGTWMSEEDHASARGFLERAKAYRYYDFNSNLDHFSLANLFFRRVAHKYKLLLREEEDTFKHGG
jgi:hypothetical protein